ncbi:YkgJ family cysteine cluster protein [Methanocella sp. CWC-04]|uniref:YkgJ family cysteine cluster protein n=2 Tax=Methanooceanicella nereidis TaxID=2052831 RepID=A0AAP2W4I9_9EURY|nr:YkgJ family cysteine cluster protein [Methanocella sp. CWC-04]
MTGNVLSYQDFKCRMCGLCCKRQKVVLLTVYDIFRLSGHLGIKPEEFFKKYCIKSDKFNEEGRLRIFLRSQGGCPFLKDNMCSIHSVKPMVCSQNPFYYLESSLAVYKVFSITQDECIISELPYDTMTKGDTERLIDLEILVNITDEYMERHKKFSEATAREYFERSRDAIADEARRSITYATLLDQSIRREDMCRNDPYYKGSTGMYLSGFYKMHLEDAGKEKAGSDKVFAFQPSALGTVDGLATLVLFDDDYKSVKRMLSGGDNGDISVKTLMHEDTEYVTMTIRPATNDITIVTYYYIDKKEKPHIQSPPGEILLNIRNGKGKSFIYRGRDKDGWLKK